VGKQTADAKEDNGPFAKHSGGGKPTAFSRKKNRNASKKKGS